MRKALSAIGETIRFGGVTRSAIGPDFGLILPREGLLSYIKEFDGTPIDIIGISSRDIQQLQNMTGGTLTHVDIVGDETVVDNGGTGSVAVSAGALTITGQVWDIELSNGWIIPFGDTTAGVAWEVVTGSHLIMSGVTCATDLVNGSDWLNQKGWTAADGSQYFSASSLGAIPVGVKIPSLLSGSSCAAWEES